MRVVLFVCVVGLVLLSACTSIETTPDTPIIPSDAQLSSCSSDADCIPIPSQCHPERCINSDYADSFEIPDACTEIFLAEAAYSAKDCGCENSVCVNKNKDVVESDLPPGANKCHTRSEICTMEYRPVCGWFTQGVNCVKAPCAITASNPCIACANEDVLYWTEGECDEG